MLGYHDALIQRLDISMVPGEWHIALTVIVDEQIIVVTFKNLWWIGLHGLAMVGNEMQVNGIEETDWSEVPVNCRYEQGGHKVFCIQLTSGSKLIVVAKAIIETKEPDSIQK